MSESEQGALDPWFDRWRAEHPGGYESPRVIEEREWWEMGVNVQEFVRTEVKPGMQGFSAVLEERLRLLLGGLGFVPPDVPLIPPGS